MKICFLFMLLVPSLSFAGLKICTQRMQKYYYSTLDKYGAAANENLNLFEKRAPELFNYFHEKNVSIFDAIKEDYWALKNYQMTLFGQVDMEKFLAKYKSKEDIDEFLELMQKRAKNCTKNGVFAGH